jgi:hypothetical protein
MKTQVINPATYNRNQQPGKFEGESPATEYFWEQMGDGETFYVEKPGMENEDLENLPSAELFHINADESEAFNLPIGFWFMLTEDSQGFVMGSTHETREQAEQKFKAWLGI